MNINEFMIKEKIISEDQMKIAENIATNLNSSLEDIMAAMVEMQAQNYYQTLAKYYGFEFVELLSISPDFSLMLEEEHFIYIKNQLVPVSYSQGIYTVATANPVEKVCKYIRARWGENTQIVCISKFDVLWVVQKCFGQRYLEEAINDLVKRNQILSAKKTFSSLQTIFLLVSLTLLICGIVYSPINIGIIINSFFTLLLTTLITYKLTLTLIGIFIQNKESFTHDQFILKDNELPIYTLMIPLLKEKEKTLRFLFRNINNIDYPKHKLEVILLLEEDDIDTISIIKNFHLPAYYELLYIPVGQPRTKAKACNYGLKFANGEYVSLYDAEDKPDPQQLKKAIMLFLQKDEKLACIQCRLNYLNIYENWLTCMFTLEYSYWFDFMLPALEYLGSPIPLGGTSNHFKTAILRQVNAWDPYNVTEDADLGVRLHRLGYKTTTMPSTTYEEANCNVLNWIKQRTRWIKGYMQTYLVHMRSPLRLFRELGFKGFIGFQLFIGGVFFSNLLNIPVWSIFIIYSLCIKTARYTIFPKYILWFAIANFIIAQIFLILLNMLAAFRRGHYRLILSAIGAPIYWLLMSVASYRALYQLFFKPTYWDKTEHGISCNLDEKY